MQAINRERLLFILALLQLLAIAALTVSAVLIWRLYCEGFGCIGIGIAWMAWGIGFALIALTGALLKWRSQPILARCLRIGRYWQMAQGLLLLVYWLWQQWTRMSAS